LSSIARVIKIEITASIVIFDDELAISEITTAPITIFRGMNFDYQQFIAEIERLAIQKYLSSRSSETKSDS